MAIVELRMILFTAEEAMRALVAFIRTSDWSLPRGTCVRIDHHPMRRDFAQLIFRTDEGDNMRFPLTEIEMAASLLNECIARRIILPRHAGKHVRVLDDQFALVLDIGNNLSPRSHARVGPRAPRPGPPTARTPLTA